MLFLQTVLYYQDFMYSNISLCPSLSLLKTTSFSASLKLSLITQKSKDPDRRGVVRTEFANVLKLDFTAHDREHDSYKC